MTLTASGVLQPGSDNSQDLGAASFRWAVVRAGTGTINTCDVRFKLFRPEPVPTGDEHAAAIECFDAFGFYQFHEAIEAKGADGARWHFGPAAQQVWSIFASHGLADPLGEDGLPPEGSNPPAFLCFDKWGDQIEERPIYSDTLVDDAGFPLKIGSETIVLRAAGNIFGVRIDQLHSLMLVALNNERKGLADRIAALEAA